MIEPSNPKSVYISGPMRGYPNFNFDAFHEAAARWRAAGWEVISPAENFEGRHDLPIGVYMREDTESLLRVSAIAMLPGWRE
jgi:hypothetical protein